MFGLKKSLILVCLATLLVLAALGGASRFRPLATAPHVSAGLSVDGAKAYFAKLPVGYPVQRIELDLGLPEPREREAPAFGWPGWKYCYFADGRVIYFEAEYGGDASDPAPHHAGSGSFHYVGNWNVWTEREYWGAIHRMLREEQRRGYWRSILRKAFEPFVEASEQ